MVFCHSGRHCAVLVWQGGNFYAVPLIRLACGEPPSPSGGRLWCSGGREVSPFLIRPGFAGPPSPPGGRFFGLQLPRNELGNCRGYSRGRRGRAPALRKVRLLFPNYCAVTNQVTPKGVGLPLWLQARNRRRHTQQNVRPPPCNEPGDTQRWWFTARASGSNCQRPLAAAYSLPVQQ